MREHVAPRMGGIEWLSAPRRGLQQVKQLGERAEGFGRDSADLVLGDRVQAQLVHLPGDLASGEDVTPRPARRRWLPG